MTARPPTTRARGDIIRALGNVIWTMAIVVGAPIALVRVFGYPLPNQMPDWGEVISTRLQLVEPQVVINVLVCIGWITWGIVIAYVVVDLVDLTRGVGHHVRRLGPASVVAGKLVASVALILSLLRAQPTSSAPPRAAVTEQIIEAPATSTTPLRVVLARADRPLPVARTTVAVPTALPTAASPSPTYLVQRGDSLWRIAEQQLGSGFRWREIHELNLHLITNPDLICVGWNLKLPADAIAPTSPAPAPTTTTPVPEPSDAAAPGPQTADQPPAVPATAPTDTATTPTTAAPQTPEVVEQPTAVVPTITPETAPSPPTKSPAPTAPTEPAPTSTAPDAAATPNAAPSTTLPLSLRAQGFETQAQYDEWLTRQHATDPGVSSPAADDNPLARAAAIVGAVAIPTLLAAAVVGAIDRRRRRVLQNRPIHAELPSRNPGLRPAEARLRSQTLAEPAEQIAWTDAVLRLLTLTSIDHPIESQLLLVRPGSFGIELLWDQLPATRIPEGFELGEDQHSWEYPCGDATDLVELQDRVADVTHHAHALVTLGDTPDGPVLVNLQAIDEIDIDGDLTGTRHWINAVAIELASHRWAEAVDTAMTAPSSTPTRLNTSIHIDDDGHARPLVWRSDRIDNPARWQLRFASGRAALTNHHTGFEFDLSAVGYDDPATADTEALLAEAAHDPYRDGPGPAPDDPPADPDDNGSHLDAGHPADDAATSHLRKSPEFLADPDPANGNQLVSTLVLDAPTAEPHTDLGQGASLVIRVLGPVRTLGWQRQPKSPRTEDIVVYLAMARPDPVSRERLIDALWNGKNVSNKLLFNYIGTLRKEIGDPDVVISTDGSYVLADAVRTDWDRFSELVDAACDQPWLQRRASLGAALSLVEGRPFDMIDRHQWASTEGIISRLEVAITDTAADLAADAIDNADYAMAIWAARRGLAACPWHVRLYGFIIEAHTAAGDPAAVEHTWRELKRAAGPDGVPDDLLSTYQAARVR